MNSCETCLALCRLTCRVRATDGHEYEASQKKCSKRNIVVTYPVDGCSQYERWERKESDETPLQGRQAHQSA